MAHRARFILRWPGRYKLADGAGNERNAWQLVRGKRAWDHRLLWDARRHCWCKTGILAVPVLYGTHSLVLVVARRGSGQHPWYLLTNEPVATVKELWRIVLSYARRWQLEDCQPHYPHRTRWFLSGAWRGLLSVLMLACHRGGSRRLRRPAAMRFVSDRSLMALA